MNESSFDFIKIDFRIIVFYDCFLFKIIYWLLWNIYILLNRSNCPFKTLNLINYDVKAVYLYYYKIQAKITITIIIIIL